LRRQERLNEDDDDSDDFDDESSHWARTKRQREIEERGRAALEHLSSPPKRSMRGVSLSKSSPIRAPSRVSSINRTRLLGESSPIRGNQTSPGNESEEETEQEDNADIAVTRSSQMLIPLDDEDKKTYPTEQLKFLETTARLLRVVNDLPAHVQESPSIRPGRR